MPGNGSLTGRILQLHTLAEAAADALLLGQPLPACDAASLLRLWPALVQLAAAPGSAGADSLLAAAGAIVLAQRPDAAAVQHVSLSYAHSSAQLFYELQADAPADAAQAAELQVSVSLGAGWGFAPLNARSLLTPCPVAACLHARTWTPRPPPAVHAACGQPCPAGPSLTPPPHPPTPHPPTVLSPCRCLPNR